MGLITSCCRPSASEVLTPDIETRRRQQSEAAERRKAEIAARGIKDAERLKRMQQKQEDMEEKEREFYQQGGAKLKWTAN